MCCAELGSGNAQRQRVYITVIFQCIRPVLCMRCVCIHTVRCDDPVRTSGTLRLGPHQLLISSVAPAIGVPEPAEPLARVPPQSAVEALSLAKHIAYVYRRSRREQHSITTSSLAPCPGCLRRLTSAVVPPAFVRTQDTLARHRTLRAV